jgi:hypothetical protein
MKPNVTSLERAFELAASGRYPTVTDVCNKLGAEGYNAAQVSGPLLRKQLLAVITKVNDNAEAANATESSRSGTSHWCLDNRDNIAIAS